MKEKILCGLDIGSSKVCAVIASCDPKNGNIEVLGIGEESCSGLKHGVVVNIENTTKAITRAVEEAEKTAEVKVKDVLVNINGNHIEGHRHQGATKIPSPDREITEEDVDRVISSARAVPLSSDRQILHAIPLDFKIDNQNGVEDPVGMEGNHLEVEVMLITGDTAPTNNLDKCIARAGLGIRKSIATALAPAKSVVADEEKELGCVLIDIGAQTINIAFFVEGALSNISEIDIGSDFITYDLAHGLRTSFKEAKRIKEDLGHAVTNESLDMEIEYLGVDGQSKNKVPIVEVNKIIEPRINDIIDLIIAEIDKGGDRHMMPGGIILSGGGAELKGIELAITNKLQDFQVRSGRPRNISGKIESVNSPKYATPLGLIDYAVNTENTLGVKYISATKGRFLDKIKAWLDDMF